MEIKVVDVESVINRWGVIAIDKWQEALVKLDVGAIDGDLMRSFTFELKKNGGDALEVIIKFLQYGRFRDMNVGRGHPLGNPGDRVKKKWYSKIKTREIAILRFIMAKQFSRLALKELESELKRIDKLQTP